MDFHDPKNNFLKKKKKIKQLKLKELIKSMVDQHCLYSTLDILS